MLSRDEYHTYKNSNEPLEQLIQQKWGEPKYGWLEEAGVCENVVSRYAQDLNVYAFADALTKAKSRRQMYDAFMDYFTVQRGHEFDYATVWKNQSEDVHPPLYYVFVHTISSFFPGSFSKWFGLAVNILFYILSGIPGYNVVLFVGSIIFRERAVS